MSNISLLDAVGYNDIDTVKILLKDPKTDVGQIDTDGNTPLILAAVAGSVEIGLLLINAGANVNQSNDNRITPLIATLPDANSSADYEFVTLLLEQPNIDLNYKNQDGDTALLIAVYLHNSDIVELLLGSGADPNITNGGTALSFATDDDDVDIVKLLLDNGADPNIPTDGDETPLFYAVRYSGVDVIELYLASPKVDLNINYTAPSTGDTVIWRVANSQNRENYLQIAKMLLDAGLDPNIPDNEGLTFLIYSEDEPDMIRLLLKYNVDVNARDSEGRTALFYVLRRNRSLAVLLTSPTLDLDIQDNNGKTALMFACERDLPDAIAFLLESGADPFMTDDTGHIAAQFATNGNVDAELSQWEADYKQQFEQSKLSLNGKLMAGRRLKGVLSEKRLPDRIVDEAEYGRLCLVKALQRNPKQDLQALAASLKIPYSSKTKTQLCQEISTKLNL
jgi:ankyrin repeat protein